MLIAGIDIGSRTTGAVIMEGKTIVKQCVDFNGSQPDEKAVSIIESFKPDVIVATGYGRHMLHKKTGCRVITEIKAHAMGASFLYPSCRTVIDIGGQDSKVIRLGEESKVTDFVMNDKCAAGTGKFLEVITQALGIHIKNIVLISKDVKQNISINNMCTVFAESEVISLLSLGVDKASIALAILNAIFQKTASMIHRLGLKEDVVFSGGVAKIPGMGKYFAEKLGIKHIIVPEEPGIIGALGAALYGSCL